MGVKGILSIAWFSRPVRVLILLLLCSCSASPFNRVGIAKPTGECRILPPDDRSAPYFEKQIETEHFILKWTNTSPHLADNIHDPQIVKETAEYFERAWERLSGLFGRNPYTAPDSSKLTVVFKDLECYAYADPPDGPIELNSAVWTRKPSIREPTSAHELFHKLQYAYGYKTRWVPSGSRPNLWFTEGTAAWAEVFVWGKVSRDCKMEDMFKDGSLDLYEAEDMALPFWIYFVSGNRETPKNHLMVRFFEEYEKTGNPKEALLYVIQEAYGSVDHFFSGFALQRKKDFWGGSGQDRYPYTCILGPGGKDLISEIKEYQRKAGS